MVDGYLGRVLDWRALCKEDYLLKENRINDFLLALPCKVVVPYFRMTIVALWGQNRIWEECHMPRWTRSLFFTEVSAGRLKFYRYLPIFATKGRTTISKLKLERK